MWTSQTYTDSVRALYGGSVVRNGVMYICCGQLNSNNYNNLYFVDFNNESLAWETATTSGTKPTSRYATQCVLHQNRYMYLWGGRGGSSNNIWFNDMHRFDFETNTDAGTRLRC